jgi:hypothetical protein
VSKLLAVAIAVLVGSYLKPALRAKVVARSDLHRTSADSVTASAAKQLKQNTIVSPEKLSVSSRPPPLGHAIYAESLFRHSSNGQGSAR